MIVSLLALALPSRFSFKGGPDAALIASVSKSTGRTICYLSAPRRNWPKSEFDFTRPSDLESILRRRYDFALDREQAWSNGAYPQNFFYKQRLSQYAGALQPTFPSPKLEWPLTVGKEEPACLTVEDLQQGCSKTKHLRFHWFFSEARLILVASSLGEEPVLSLVAKAVGGKLTSGSEFYIDLDTKAFRNRALKTFKEEADAARSRSAVLDARYLEELYSTLTDRQLEELYKSPSSSLTLQIAEGSDLQRAALERFWEMVGDRDADPRQLRPSQVAMRKQFLDRIDFSKGVWIVAKPDGVPSCMLKGYDDWKLVF